MRSITAVVLTIAVVLFPAAAYAGCPSRSDFLCPSGGFIYSVFTFDTSCASTTGLSANTMSCYSKPAWQWTSSTGQADYTMTVPTGYGGSHWSVEIFVDFTDPDANVYNGLAAYVYVHHNGSINYSNNFFNHNGTQGSLSCNLEGTSYFTVADGDTVEVYLFGTNATGNASILVSAPQILTNC